MAKFIKLDLNIPPKVEARGNPFESPSISLGNLGAIWSWISGTEPTSSGEIIDEFVAMQITTVYRCVRIISESIATLPLKLYRRLPKGREEAVEDALYNLLTVAPNPEMGAVTFWETVVGCLALTGNSYVYIQRVGGEVVALWPLNPKRTSPYRLPNGTLAFKSTDGVSDGSHRIYNANEILHFRLWGWDGLLGLSPIMLNKQSLGLAQAALRLGSRIYQNGGRPAGVMSTEQNLDQKTLQNLRESWAASQTGDNALKTAFLPGGFKYTPISLDMEDIEFLKTRAFQRTEICALFGIPAHMAGDTTRQSNVNSQNEALTLVTFCLRPYLSRIENEIARTLLSTYGSKDDNFFVEFDIRQLLRGDFETTQKALAVGRQWGWLSANDCLEVLGENPIPGPAGDAYIVPLNMQNLQTIVNPAAPKPVGAGVTMPKELGPPANTENPNEDDNEIQGGDPGDNEEGNN